MKRILLLCGVCGLLGVVAGQRLSLHENQWTWSAAPSPSVFSPAAAVEPRVTAPRTPEEEANIRVYQAAHRSVVNINTRSVQIDSFFSMLRESEGSGSGTVYDTAGHIVTNYHVVDGARTIEVTFASNKSFPAQLVGGDKESDIAVLRVDAPPAELYPVNMGRSDDLQVGQRTYALGNPFSWGGTLTAGIISSLNRDLPSRVPSRTMQSLIQTDAAMNPGNSGGPLLDSSARMIGMCVAIATRTGINSGVGFAIPINRIKRVVPELIRNGRLVRASIGIAPLIETDTGLVIARLEPNGPAEKAGLRGFRRIVERRRQGPVTFQTEMIDRSHADRILAIDGEPVRAKVQFLDKIETHKPGDVVRLTIVRDGKQQEISVELGSN